MTPSDLTAAGRALYGERWKHALGKALFPGKKPATSERMIHRWLSGATAMPADLPDRMSEIAEARAIEIWEIVLLDPQRAWGWTWKLSSRAKPKKGG